MVGHGGRDAGGNDSGTTWRFRERWAWALGRMVRLEFEMRRGGVGGDSGIYGEPDWGKEQLRCLRDIQVDLPMRTWDIKGHS